VCIHGGGWHGGSRAEFVPLTVELAYSGFIAATIEYRLAPENRYPAQLDDVQNTVRWLRANAAELGVDPTRIYLWGWSAGGHLACLAGVEPEAGSHAAVQGVVAFSPLTDLTAECWKTVPMSGQKLLGASVERRPDLWAEASSVTHVDASDPPFVFCHGGADHVVPIGQTRLIVERLEQAGVETSVFEEPRNGHRWFGRSQRRAYHAAIGVLQTWANQQADPPSEKQQGDQPG
jgi:acetyl esterase/lipase